MALRHTRGTVSTFLLTQSSPIREMAVGNTFGATALSSYGGFWISFAITLTPGGFEIVQSLTASNGTETEFYNSFGFFLIVSFVTLPLLLQLLKC